MLHGEVSQAFSVSLLSRKILGKQPEKWQGTLRSNYGDDRKFNGYDQPALGVNWYAARAYCYWLSCLEAELFQDFNEEA